VSELRAGEEARSEITWADEALRLLARAGRMLGATLDYQATLTALGRLLVPAVADVCTIYLLDDDQAVRVQVAHRDPEAEVRARAALDRYPPDPLRDASPIGRVIRTGRSLLLPEVTDDFYRAVAVDAEQERLLRAIGFRSIAVAALTAHGRTLGALGVAITCSDRIYGEADLLLLEEIAARAALAVEHARLFEAERESRRVAQRAIGLTERLLKLAGALGSATSPEEAATMVVRHGIEASGAVAGSLAELAPDGEEVRLLHWEGYPDAVVPPGGRFPLSSPFPICEAIRTGRPVYLHSPAERAAAYPHLAEARRLLPDGAIAALPFEAGGRVAGAIGYSWAEPRTFAPEERAFLALVAETCGLVADRLRAECGRERVERLDTVGRLAGGMAHEINNLMTVVMGSAELLRMEGRLDPALEAEVRDIQSAAERAAGIVTQLLAFGRRMRGTYTVTTLDRLVRGALPRLRRTLPPGIAVELALDADRGDVRADARQIAAMLGHLLRNAVEAMPHGGRITITTAAERLAAAALVERIGARVPAGSYVRLTVRDEGVGMSPAVLARAFEPFFTTKSVGAGTGLGLATVYGMVKQHDGYVWIESAPGEGTAVHLLFPERRGA
jgi:signal transduction histidine kinase